MNQGQDVQARAYTYTYSKERERETHPHLNRCNVNANKRGEPRVSSLLQSPSFIPYKTQDTNRMMIRITVTRWRGGKARRRDPGEPAPISLQPHPQITTGVFLLLLCVVVCLDRVSPPPPRPVPPARQPKPPRGHETTGDGPGPLADESRRTRGRERREGGKRHNMKPPPLVPTTRP